MLKSPHLLVERITGHGSTLRCVVIDEVQKLPTLLNIVHQHIEVSKRAGQPLQFILTGSSARKLRRGAANLLAGRAFLYSLFPLTHIELGAQCDLQAILQYGSLPALFRTHEDAEVDVIIERPGKSPLLVEITSSDQVDATELKPMERIARDVGPCECLCLCRESHRRQVGSTLMLPWQEGLRHVLTA